MLSPKTFIDSLSAAGVDFYAGVPDSLLKNICAYITDNFPAENNIITANEGNAVAVAAGHWLATGHLPLVYMQNSGIGNAVNPLLSLADEKVYSIPMVLLIGWRGEPGIHDEPQHVKQGAVTLPLLDAMEIPCIILPDNEEEAPSAIARVCGEAIAQSKPHAIVVRKGTFGKYVLKNTPVNPYPLSREQALKCVVAHLPEDAAVVSTTGKLSRELFEYREARGEGHGHDFLTVGSMGHSSSIALGIALACPDRHIFCFDGDGAFIMHSGALGNIGRLAPRRFIHILFNNGAHESVGGQPTLGFDIDVLAIARANGYTHAWSVQTENQISDVMARAMASDGPSLIEIRVGTASRDDLGRPTTTPVQNKNAFMNALRPSANK